MKSLQHALYHVMVILLSAAIAVSLPVTVGFAARKLLALWTFVENEEVFLVGVEIIVAVVLIFLFNHLTGSYRDRKLASMARRAGLTLVASARGFFSRKRVKERVLWTKFCAPTRLGRG